MSGFFQLIKRLRSLIAICLILVTAIHGQKPTDPTLIPKYAQAEALFWEAQELEKVGTVTSRRAAILKYQTAAALYRETGSTKIEAIAINNLGSLHATLGERELALLYYDLSLTLRRAVGDKRGEARTLNNIGLLQSESGEHETALGHYDKALSLMIEVGDKIGEATILSNIGLAYHDLGQLQNALDHYNRALLLQPEVGDKRREAITLDNIGTVYHDLGQYQNALDNYNRALSLRRQVGDKEGEATSYSNIGVIHSARSETQKALEFYKLALQLKREAGDKRGEAVTLSNMGLAYYRLGRTNEALELYGQSLSIKKQVGDRSGESVTLGNMMDAWVDLKVPRLAILYGKQAVNIHQDLRMNIQGLDRETQKTYLESVEHKYRKLANILIEQGRIAEAEQVLGMLKEEEYFSYVRRDDKVAADLKGRISLSPEEKKAFDDYERTADEITRSAAAFGLLERKMNDLPLGESLNADDQRQFDAFKAKYDAAVTVFNKFLDDLKIRFASKGKQFAQVAAVESDTQGILKRLGEHRTVIISTIVGDDRLNLIVTTSDVQRAHSVDITSVEINKLVTEFRSAVRNPRVDPRPPGKKLYDILFPASLQKDLSNIRADAIVWSLDGTLRYVPMAALWDGENYLARRFRSSMLTLASRDKLGQPAKDLGSLVFGVGVSRPYQNFDALPAVPRELCSIVADPKKTEYCETLGGSRGVMNGMILADDEFTLNGFRNNLGKTGIVHIATHFSLNAGNEVDSYLLLGGGAERRFTLKDLRSTRLDNVDVLTLSACNTAMTSGSNSNGVEIEGFGALAQKQGARSVVASLWSVADESTSVLMSEFYRIRKENPSMSKSAAMQVAQIAMIDGKIKASGRSTSCRADDLVDPVKKDDFKCDPNAPFSHPYFWSPFVLIGNWR